MSGRTKANPTSGLDLPPKYTDLKLIDELLCDLKQELGDPPWKVVEFHTSITLHAMLRLRRAYTLGEMELITLSLAKYFQGEVG